MPSQPAPGLESTAAASAEPAAEARVTSQTRLGPAPEARPASDARALGAGTHAVRGARSAVRASIAPGIEPGSFIVRQLGEGEAPGPGAHEALIVLLDPNARVFQDPA